MGLCFLKNVYGGLLLSAGGELSLALGMGFPNVTNNDLGLMRLLQGITFPIGLVIVYFLGAELYTGYGMWFAMTALSRRGKPTQYIRAIIASLLGNYLGAFLWATLQSYLTETLTEEPWRGRIISSVDSDFTDNQFHIIFLRSIGCGFLVTIAMLMGTQNRDGISKALGLHLPFFISTVLQFPHTVESMYMGTTGMLLGSRLTVWKFLWKCLLPVILGNAVGGAFTGAYNWYVYVKRKDDKQRSDGRDWLPVSSDD
ncbi:hypothetical protein BAUCODRAFT_123949 [Baudoinia panamericana UAMH 10762]|uniref:Formate/nitrite transporter n=1 Tax=Baudoinia panamericana (strain UAMH 10762) TaxID=717646 RepID=M2N5I6_BAUPA|nr:uncharacterized protein BAUCODRAFT_123949 [Baudoinia panamericana UAMH 10762]EMC94309.1 hypothetical protein BAUCODRAFT_123949 [Baudoinia panamericana UAMH 10762]